MSTWKSRLAKAVWARNNPEKVRQANRNWRASHQTRYNSAAAERMRRMRARRRVPMGS